MCALTTEQRTAKLLSNPLSAFIMFMLATYHQGLGLTKQEINVSLSLTGGPAQTREVLG